MTERTRKIFDLLGVEPNEKFKINDKYENEYNDTIFYITDNFHLIDDTDATYYELFRQLLTSEYTIVKLTKKKKLRDLTIEEFRKWVDKNCITNKVLCKDCPFNHVNCDVTDKSLWLNYKDLYSDKFLDQEIEVE